MRALSGASWCWNRLPWALEKRLVQGTLVGRAWQEYRSSGSAERFADRNLNRSWYHVNAMTMQEQEVAPLAARTPATHSWL